MMEGKKEEEKENEKLQYCSIRPDLGVGRESLEGGSNISTKLGLLT